MRATSGDRTATTENGASAVSATSAAPPAASAPQKAQLEVDFVFPRNETYKASDIFPVAFAFHGLDAMRTLPKFKLKWFIMPYAYGRIPGGIDFDWGNFEVPTEGDSFIAVANTNVSNWLHRANRSDRFMMIWAAIWDDWDESDRCGMPRSLGNRIMFSIQPVGIDSTFPELQDAGLDAKIPTEECPILSNIYDIRRNATDPEKCFIFLDGNTTGMKTDPCAAGIDEDSARSIESQAASLATSSWLLAHPDPTSSSTSSNFAPFPTAPAGSTFVAVSLVTYLTFGF